MYISTIFQFRPVLIHISSIQRPARYSTIVDLSMSMIYLIVIRSVNIHVLFSCTFYYFFIYISLSFKSFTVRLFRFKPTGYLKMQLKENVPLNQIQTTQTSKNHLSLFKRCRCLQMSFKFLCHLAILTCGPLLKSRFCINGKHTSTSRITFRIRSYHFQHYAILFISDFIYQRHVLNVVKFLLYTT